MTPFQLPQIALVAPLLAGAPMDSIRGPQDGPEQLADGRWPGDAPGADLAATSAMLWALLGDGHTPSRGARRSEVIRSLEWISEHAFTGSDDTLAPGEALAALAVADVAWADGADAGAAACSLRARARLLEAQRPDGTWAVDGSASGSPAAIEATGWAACALLATGARTEAEDAAIARALDALDADATGIARAFDLYLDVRTGAGGDARGRFEALHRGAAEAQRTPTLDLLATATAWSTGGDLWRSWSEGEARDLVAAQGTGDGPKFAWPETGDRRGATFELGLRLVTAQVYFRYGRTFLTR